MVAATVRRNSECMDRNSVREEKGAVVTQGRARKVVRIADIDRVVMLKGEVCPVVRKAPDLTADLIEMSSHFVVGRKVIGSEKAKEVRVKAVANSVSADVAARKARARCAAKEIAVETEKVDSSDSTRTKTA